MLPLRPTEESFLPSSSSTLLLRESRPSSRLRALRIEPSCRQRSGARRHNSELRLATGRRTGGGASSAADRRAGAAAGSSVTGHFRPAGEVS